MTRNANDSAGTEGTQEAVHLSRRLAVSGLLLAGGLSLPSKRAVASGGGNLCTSYSDLVNAIAAIGPTGGVVRCQPGAVITFGSSPLVIANKRYLTLDLTGVEIQSTANIGNTQLYAPALICLQNCSDCLVKGKALIAVNGYANSALGLESCTNCDVEHLIAQGCNIGFGQFFSVGSTRCAWRFCDSVSGQGTARGFWLGGDQSNWGETDLEVLGCRAIGNPATGIAVASNGAKIIGNTSTDNAGAGICSSSTGGGSVSYYHTIANNDCRRNAFWGWQSDVWDGTQLYNTTVSGNLFDSNQAGAALLNACTTIMYGGNVDNGMVQVLNCTGGKVQLGPQAILDNGGANTNVTFS
jgi:hypothetical protein